MSTLDKLTDELLMGNPDISPSEVAETVSRKARTMTQEDLTRKQFAFHESVKKSKKVGVAIAPQYAAEFGNNLPVIINGIKIYVPVDGKTYKIPELYAAEVKRRIAQVNQKLNRFKKKGDTSEVLFMENNIGEVKIFN